MHAEGTPKLPLQYRKNTGRRPVSIFTDIVCNLYRAPPINTLKGQFSPVSGPVGLEGRLACRLRPGHCCREAAAGRLTQFLGASRPEGRLARALVPEAVLMPSGDGLKRAYCGPFGASRSVGPTGVCLRCRKQLAQLKSLRPFWGRAPKTGVLREAQDRAPKAPDSDFSCRPRPFSAEGRFSYLLFVRAKRADYRVFEIAAHILG